MKIQLSLREYGTVGFATALHIHNFDYNKYQVRCSLFINVNGTSPCFKVAVLLGDKEIDDQRVYDSDATVMQNHLDQVLAKYS